MLNKLFKFDERKANTKTEIIAGITTFLSMAYILGVNPTILSEAGMPISGVFFSTAIASCIACIVMGLISNYPVGLAPVMGLNALFTYTIIISMGNTWESALAAVFISSILFLLITISGLREKIMNAFPSDLKSGVGAGIGFFLAFIGFRSANIIVSDPSTLIAMGNLLVPSTFLALIGIFLTAVFFVRKVPAGIFFAILLTSLLGLVFTFFGYGANDPLMPHIPTTFISFNFDLSLFGGFLRGFGQLFSNIPNMIVIIFSVVFISFFDTTGTLISLSQLCGFTDENGEIAGFEKAMTGNAIGGIIGAICGTSTVSSYVESATGIEVGGKTGFTAIITGICFLISIVFAPIILALFTTPVTASALILVGVLMVNQLENVRLSDPIIGTSIFITITMTLLTNSISYGIAWGFSLFAVLEILAGRFKELNPSILILSMIFIAYLFFGL